MNCLFFIVFLSLGEILGLSNLHSGKNIISIKADQEVVLNDQIYHISFLSKYNALIGEYQNKDSNWIHIWSVRNGETLKILSFNKDEKIHLLKISQDQEKLVIVTFSKEGKYSLKCYSFKVEKWLWQINIQKDSYFGISFLQERNWIALVSRYQYYIFSTEDGKILIKTKSIMNKYYSNNIRMLYVNFSYSGRYLLIWNQPQDRGDNLLSWLATESRNYVTVWDIIESKEIIVFQKGKWELTAAAFTQDEKFLILSCSDNKVRKWSISENIPVKELEFNAGLYMLSSENVLIVGQRNSATILDYPNLETKKYIDNISIDSYNPIIPKITISDDGKYLAFIKGCKLFLYELESWNELWSTEFCKSRND